MKKSFLSLSLAILCLTAVMTSCLYDPHTGEVVIKERVCVDFNQYETDAVIETRVICDKFREVLMQRLADHGKTLADVKDIKVNSAAYKVTALTGHDWIVDADVFVDYENDKFYDEPKSLIKFKSQSLQALTGGFTNASLKVPGVMTLNKALDDLVAGADPIVYIGLRKDAISPMPSGADPLDFSWTACVEFQAVIDMTVD